MHSNIRVGAVVDVTIRRFLPTGILVDLDDGKEGVVRKREVSWRSIDKAAWPKLFPPGSRQRALALKEGERNWELSLRLAKKDPWQAIHEKYQVGDLYEGVVADIVGRRVFIELEPAVTGILTAERLPEDVAGELNALFWIGDRVRAEALAIREAQREIDLTMRTLQARRWEGYVALGDNGVSTEVAISLSPAPRLPLELFASGRLFSILLVEDDSQQLEAMAHWLRNVGQIVAAAPSAEEALKRLEAESFELLISDVGLPGMDGIALARRVVEAFPAVRIALVTDWSTSDLRRAEIDALGHVALLLKPVLPEDLLEFLADGPTSAEAAGPDKTANRLVATQRADLRKRRRFQVEDYSVSHLLDKLRKETRATKAVLFHFDTLQRRFEIAGEDGSPPLDDQALIRLIHSPVRDVAEDSEIVEVEDAALVDAYVKYLSPLLPFRSCVGMPVPSQQRDQYALFLFHPQPGFAGASVVSAAQATAGMLGAALERQAFLQRAAEMQRLELTGHLTRALIHEINHQLSPLIFALDDLRCQCNDLEKKLEREPERAHDEMRRAQETLTKLNQNIQHLVQTTRIFGRVASHDQEQMVRIDQVVTNSTELLRDMADRAHIRLSPFLPKHILLTFARPTQVQQILLNVMLNAIQQIELLRPKTGGQVRIAATPKREQDGAFICLTVEDDGPGIHTRMLESIFELGVTTRKEGSGMGLYLARRLAEDLGGSLEVEESAVLWGARMRIRLPIHFSK